MKRRIIEALHRIPGRFIQGTPVWDFEWDILTIVDGCRVDTFRYFHPDAAAYWSVEASSRQWLAATFDARDLSRVGYISANPFAADLDADRFGYYHLEPVRRTADGIETVPPKTLTERAVSAWRRRDELGIDRLVVHFMQPHVPFRSRPEWFQQFENANVWGSEVWRQVAAGEIDRQEWFKAYRDNLRWVLEDGVAPLRTHVDATVGVTADHGNAAGEWGIAGHPHGVAVPVVRRVPWYRFDAERTRDDVDTVELDPTHDVDEREQLSALGYR